jgi:dCTP deaminase
LILQDSALRHLEGSVFTKGAHIGPSSVDLTLSSSFLQLDPQYGGIYAGKEVQYRPVPPVVEDRITIPPHRFYLASTQEIIRLPDSLVGWICGRSSVGRIGLQVQNAGFIDAGFQGQITLELANQTHYPITLKIGMRICQLVLARQEKPSEHPYDGKYQRQIGATGSRLFED